MLLLDRKKRLKMIQKALQAQAPKTYRGLLAAGKLKSFLEDYEEQMMQSFHQDEEERDQAIDLKGENTDGLQRIREYNRAESEAWEQTLATWLEFNDNQITGSPQANSPDLEAGSRKQPLTSTL
jgi:hypothetical protein